MAEKTPLRLYADELRNMASLLAEMPTAVTLPGQPDSWIRYPSEGIPIQDADFGGRKVRLGFDYEAETWYVEVDDE